MSAARDPLHSGPEIFGNYLLDSLIAEGGMGRVYRARLRGFGGFEKPLVVKQILPELAQDSRFVSMFVEEAKTLVRLAHPHIVPVYELGVVDGVYFLAMERIDGAAFRELLRDGPLPHAAAAQLASQLASALHHAHSRFGLIHRDVSPGNVLVDLSGHSRLVDFGVATPADGAQAGVFGTPGYLAPEQLEGRPEHRSDVFGLGAILYTGLSGDAPYPPSLEELREVFARGEAPPPLPADVPPELAAIALDCLSVDPAQRPADAEAARRRLRGWLASAHPGGELDELADRAARARRRASERPPPHEPKSVATPVGIGTQKSLATAASFERERVGEAGDGGPSTERLDAPSRKPIRQAPTPMTLQVVDRARVAPPAVHEAAPADPDDVSAEGSAHEPKRRPVALLVGLVTIAALLVGGWLATRETGERDGLARVEGDPVQTREAPPGEASMSSELGPDSSMDAVAMEASVMEAVAMEAVAMEASVMEALEPDESAMEERAARSMESRVTEMRASMSGTSRPTMDTTRPAARGAARLSVQATPWAEVRIDGSPVGNTPRRNVTLPAGTHRVQLVCPPLGRAVTVPLPAADGEDLRVLADLSVDPPTFRVIRR